MHNSQLELARNFVQYTQRNIFLTGKAGTGKTTFLHELRKISAKRMVVVAPTGVAAMNAGGTTIHSFFQLPFGPYLAKAVSGSPARQSGQKNQQRFGKEKIDLLRSLDILVIDEISMVRADLLDGIDETLRRYRDWSKPFGGVQVLMIGDLHQLSPVVKDDDWQILRDYYPNLYFFSSRALQHAPAITIELLHIYRQSDSFFIDLLNAIRENRLEAEHLEQLNSRYLPDFRPADDAGYITLTTHNASANRINDEHLEALDEKPHTFPAAVSGAFPEFSYPTVPELVLKTNAQVMFVKNDSSRDKLYYNGKIGRITGFQDDTILVKCPGDAEPIAVLQAEWKNISYHLNEAKEVEETVDGVFAQYPLKLAWAITIHKSQGLTFERAIIDAAASFAHGQVYVALSRCKSFEGLVLRTPIRGNSVKTDQAVATFTRIALEHVPGEDELKAAMTSFQQSLIYELFDFGTVRRQLAGLQKLVQDHDQSLESTLGDALLALREEAERSVHGVAENFKRQLAGLFQEDSLPEADLNVIDRLRKAGAWFNGQTDRALYQPALALTVVSDNKEVKKLIGDALDNLRKTIFIKLQCFGILMEGFAVSRLIKARADAGIEYDRAQRSPAPRKKPDVAPGNANFKVYAELKQWRDTLAATRKVPVYIVLPQKVLEAIATMQPQTLKDLEKLKGIGKTKIKNYGETILKIIENALA